MFESIRHRITDRAPSMPVVQTTPARTRAFVPLVLALCLLSSPLGAQDTDPVAEALSSLELRNLGPFRPGSWITAIAVPITDDPDYLYTFYLGARNGGVWKTTNLGTTFENVTDPVDISAVGSLAIAPSDPDQLWVGTGDAEMARSSYSGTGVWRSLDGGESWEQRGLEDSHHVARIVVHPENPDRVWVASMGHLFSENPERGVFRTDDGGESWQHVLDLGPKVGVVDLIIDPSDPDRLWAAAYDKVRLPWHFEAGGEGSGIYRTEDGGRSWTELGGGLPTGKLGRIGIDVHHSDPRILYAVIENLNERPPTEEEAEEDREADKEPEPRPIGNEVYRSDDRGNSWRRVSPEHLSIGSKSAYAFNEIRVGPKDPDKVYVISESLLSSVDGGVTWRDLDWPPTEMFAEMFGDVRSFWIDPRDPRRMILGSDGGVALSWDGGKTSDWLPGLPLNEVYAVAVDQEDPYHVYAGLQDHEVWRGPVNSWSGAVGLEDWVVVGRWDGMYTQVSPDGRWAYTTTQFGNHLRADLELGRWAEIEPQAPEDEPEYRWTWTTPIQLSPHDPDVLWTGAQKLLRSSDRGETWEERSPDLTTDDAIKIAGEGHIQYCTITTLAESHLQPGLIWVGTDDGRVWLTRDLGESWIERTDELAAAGSPVDRWVSRVAPSRHVPGRAWVSRSGYRRDDFRPYLYRTDDYGESWVDLSAGLPEAPISVVLEDPHNPELLFVGHDLGVHASLDGGKSWYPLAEELPTVPVRDLVIQEREADLVIGTYGRGVWVGDIRELQQLTAEVRASSAHLFELEPKPSRLTERSRWGNHQLYGDSFLEVPNEPDALSIDYWLGEALDQPATIRIREPGSGEELATIAGSSKIGLHRLLWPSRDRDNGEDDGSGEEDSEDSDEFRDEEEGEPEPEADPDEPAEATRDRPARLEPGELEIVLEAGDQTLMRRVRVLEPPPMPVNP